VPCYWWCLDLGGSLLVVVGRLLVVPSCRCLVGNGALILGVPC